MEIIHIIMIILIILLIIIITIIAVPQRKSKKEDNRENNEQYNVEEYYPNEPIEEYYPYHRKKILTKNEYYFYKRLKEIANQYNLQILTKIRLADLIEVNKGLSPSDWGRYFAKIKSKHIDFALADDMKIILLIELDDSSHYKIDRQERDIFVNEALIRCGYNLARTFGDVEVIENALQDILYA